MLTLYYGRNTCARATHIALLDANAEFTTVCLDLSANQQNSPEYLMVNAKGRVPSLVTEHGVLTETPALLAYIAQRYPAASLAPLNDPFAFARLQEFNAYLCATFHVAHGHLSRPQRWVSDPAAMEEIKRAAPAVIAACWSYLENHAFCGPWAMGDSYTICDPYLYTVTSWMEYASIERSHYPRIAEHYRRMCDLPNVQRMLAVGG